MNNTLQNDLVVLVSKSSIEAVDSKNAIGSTLQSAGFDVVSNPLEADDTTIINNIRFEAVKGAEALATKLELYQSQSVATLLGDDTLGEAVLLNRLRGIRTKLETITRLGIGECRMRILTPSEDPVASPSDLQDRTIFSKYPLLAQQYLQSAGATGAIRGCNGADTRVNEWRNSASVAALEIVDSGRTAKKMGLRVEDDIDYSADVVDFNRIATDLKAVNLSRISDASRVALRRLGLALESAVDQSMYTSITFNIKRLQLEDLRTYVTPFAMKGITISDQVSSSGTEYISGEIFVSKDVKSEALEALMRSGAEDIGSNAVRMSFSLNDSSTMKSLPFDEVLPGNTEDQLQELEQESSASDLFRSLFDLVQESKGAGLEIDGDGNEFFSPSRIKCLQSYAFTASRAIRKMSDAKVSTSVIDLLRQMADSLIQYNIDLLQLSEPLVKRGTKSTSGFEVFDELEETVRLRAMSDDQSSTTVQWLEFGSEPCAAKLFEECYELSVAQDRQSVIEESADVIYRLFVALRSRGLDIKTVLQYTSDA